MAVAFCQKDTNKLIAKYQLDQYSDGWESNS